MRVGLVMYGSQLAQGGGAERRFFRLWRHFQDSEIDVYLLINSDLRDSAVAAGLLAPKDHKHLYVVDSSKGIVLSVALFKALRALQLDVVHFVLPHGKLVLLYGLAWLQGRFRIAHTVSLSFFAHETRVPLRTSLLSQFLWHVAHAIDSLYPGFRSGIARRRGFAEKVFVAPGSFSDPSVFAPASVKVPQIVFSGRLIPEKNPLLFLEALALLTKSDTEWTAVMAGGGPLLPAVSDRIERLGLSHRVKIEERADMSAVLASSSVFVSLQQTENYPSQSLLEAMLAENAVVATDVGETRRLVVNNETGLLVPGTPQAVAAAISRLLTEKDTARRMGQNAARWVCAHHSIERFADHLREVWEFAKRPKPSPNY